MKIHIKPVTLAFTYLIFAMLFSSSCRLEPNGNQTIVDNGGSPTPTLELNEKRLPAMSFRAWHRTKPGMILDEANYKFEYLAAPGAKPEPFDDYEIKRYTDYTNRARSHSGKVEIAVNKFNERTKYTSCCAIQEFDYETVLAEVAAPENQTKLSDENWEFKGWSPDDKLLLFTDYRELFLVSAETKEKIPVLANADMWRFAFDPRGRGLFIIDRRDEVARLEYFDFSNRRLTAMFSPLGTEPEISVSPDSGKLALFFKVFTGGTMLTADNFLYLFDTESKAKIAEYRLPTGAIHDYSDWREDGRELGFTVWSENYARDIYSVNVEDGKTTLWYPPAGETTGLYK